MKPNEPFLSTSAVKESVHGKKLPSTANVVMSMLYDKIKEMECEKDVE